MAIAKGVVQRRQDFIIALAVAHELSEEKPKLTG